MLQLVSLYQISTSVGQKWQKWNLDSLFWAWRNSLFRVFTAFESFTVCAFSLSVTEFLEFKFLQVELLLLRVVTVVES